MEEKHHQLLGLTAPILSARVFYPSLLEAPTAGVLWTMPPRFSRMNILHKDARVRAERIVAPDYGEKDPIFEVNHLSLDYPSGRSHPVVEILNDVSFRVERGHALTLVGPSGSGKSSLLRCLNRLVEPTSGTVRFNGYDIRSLDPRELRRRVALVMQTPVMFEGTVRDNLCIRPAGRTVLTLRGHSIPAYTFRLLNAEAGVSPAAPLPGSEPVTDIEVSRADRVTQMVPGFGSLTEPVGDGAMLATWMLIQAARPRATVFLCGHGGDEVLGGYRLSQDRFRLALLQRLAFLPLAWINAPLDRFLYGKESVAERRRQLREAPASKAPAVARYLIHRPLPYEDIVQLFGGDRDPYLDVVDCLYRSCAVDACDLDRMQQVMLQTFLSHNILPFADSAAMDSSAELRMPFLDRDLAEFVLGLPAAFRVSRWPGRANTKRILRWWAAGRVASEVITRRKRHFQFGSIGDLLRHHETTLKSRILDVGAVRRVLPGVEAWLSRPPEAYRGPWEGTLWALEALGIWCERVGACS